LLESFSCFHDRDHVHPHIHANSYTGSYAKHAIHPPKIDTPKSKIFSLLVILQKERGVIEKKRKKENEYMLKKQRKNVLQSKSIEKKREKESMTPSKIKSRGESQSNECLEKQTKILHTLAHLDQVA
jgi:hypothetical protein